MTHLPEVEVIRKDLEKEVVGKRIKDVMVRHAGVVARHRTRPEFVKALQGHKIKELTRRGTWLVFHLDNDTSLVVNPGPQGSLSRETATEDAGKHTQMVATFTTGGALHYTDPSKDGEMFVVADDELATMPELSPEGIDPLADTFTWPSFSQQLKARPVPLKSLLVDQSFVVGLGDLYSDEILWAASLSGSRESTSLSSQEVRRLYRAILEVLFEAVKQGGTSDAVENHDPFADLPPGTEHVRVFGMAGRPCPRCRQPIVLQPVAGHECYHCPNCQT